jgi:hypothetical protein
MLNALPILVAKLRSFGGDCRMAIALPTNNAVPRNPFELFIASHTL